jgi:hypothetical protein
MGRVEEEEDEEEEGGVAEIVCNGTDECVGRGANRKAMFNFIFNWRHRKREKKKNNGEMRHSSSQRGRTHGLTSHHGHGFFFLRPRRLK